jgi:hypothetical protein
MMACRGRSVNRAMNDRFQFSIRSLLLLTALVAGTLAAFVSEPSQVGISARLACGILWASLVTVAAVFARGVSRAFWIGAAIPCAVGGILSTMFAVQLLAVYGGMAANPMAVGYAQAILASWGFAPVNGLLCAVVYWIVRSGPATASRPPALSWPAIVLLMLLVGLASGVTSYFCGKAAERAEIEQAETEAEAADDADEESPP